MCNDCGDGERERGRKHERHAEDAIRDIRGVRVGDDDDANEPEGDAERGGGGELLVGETRRVSAGVTTGTSPNSTAATPPVTYRWPAKRNAW